MKRDGLKEQLEMVKEFMTEVANKVSKYYNSGTGGEVY